MRGHTKNLCDRMFNLLKKRYHKSQIYSIKKLTSLLNELDNIFYYHVTSEVFFDYNRLLNTYYKNIPSGSVKKNHHFWVNDDKPTTMFTLTYHGDEEAHCESYDYCIRMNDRIIKLQEAINNKVPLKAPGMKPIKQVELWKKWGQFISEDERQELCPKPPDDIIKAVAKDKASKQAAKKRDRAART